MPTSFEPREYAPLLREELPFPILFAGVSGAHLYGFASPDSDVDLRACHVLPVAGFLRLEEPRLTLDRTWTVDGVEIDLVSHDLKKFVTLLLRQNGNYLEQLFAPLVVIDSEWAEELRAIMRQGGVARHAYHAYAHYARGKWQEWRADALKGQGRLKSLLYAYRVSLTGIHLLRTGEPLADLRVLAPLYGLDGLLAVIAAKTAEHIAVPLDVAEHDRTLERLQEQMAEAFAASPLPEAPTNRAALEDFVLRVRLACDRSNQP